MEKKNKTKEKGFTLIEILVTILIISIVFGIGTYFLLNIVNNSKNKSKTISLNNIKSSAALYAREYPDNLIWKENGSNKYACVTIQDLINSGFYKEKDIESVTNIKHVILTKNNNNTIINEELDDNKICELPPNQYVVKFDKNFTLERPSQMPPIVCVRNTDCILSENLYKRVGYTFIGWSTKKNGDPMYKDKEAVKNITTNTEITLYAIWRQNKVLIRYYVSDGKIEDQTIRNGEKNNWTTTESGIIKKNGKSYIDYYYGATLENGLANYNNKDYINITKKGYQAVPKQEWCQKNDEGKIDENKCYDQDEKLTNIGMGEEKNMLCDARDTDCVVNLYLNWKKNTITVRYHPNGGIIETPTTKSDGTKTYEWVTAKDGTIRIKTDEGDKELHVLEYDSKTDASGLKNYNNKHYINIKKTGHIAVSEKEWCTHKENGKNGKCFSQGNQKIPADELCDASQGDCTVTLYVNWRKTKVYFRFYENEGTAKTVKTYNGDTYRWKKDEEGALMYKKNDAEYKYIKNGGIEYGDSINLVNYNGNSLEITREGNTHHVDDGKEWCTGTSANGRCYDQNKDYTNIGAGTASDYFCDAREKDCRIDLYVGWKISKFRVKYNANGGTGKLASKVCERGTNCILDNNSYTKKGYTFKGWNTKADGTGTEYKEGGNVKDAGQHGETITYYAQWTPNKIIIRYHPNGGDVTSSGIIADDGTIRTSNNKEVQTVDYGSTTKLVTYNNYLKIKKIGYTGKEKEEWCTKSNGKGTCYNQKEEVAANELCDASKGNCYIKLYVHWRKNKVIVRYHPNGGTVAPTTEENQWTVVNGIIRKNGGEVQTLNYGGTSDGGLYDYNGSKLKITKSGYHAYVGQEWCNNKGECYNQSEKLTNVGTGSAKNQLCDASEKDCIANMYLNWKRNPIISFTPNDGSYQVPKEVKIECSSEGAISKFDAWDEKNDHGSGNSNPRTITFSSTGTRTITATCTSKSGKTVTEKRSFNIYSTPPTITFNPNGGSYQSPKQVIITCSAGVNNLTAHDEKYDYGFVSGNSRIINLESTGTRTITATCTANGGASTTTTRSFTITAPPSSSNPSNQGGNSGGGTSTPAPAADYCEVWLCQSGLVIGMPERPCLHSNVGECIICNRNGQTFHSPYYLADGLGPLPTPQNSNYWVKNCPIPK